MGCLGSETKTSEEREPKRLNEASDKEYELRLSGKRKDSHGWSQEAQVERQTGQLDVHSAFKE